MSEDYAEPVPACPLLSFITKPVDLAIKAVEEVVEFVNPGVDVIPDE
jgi:hypothetical protein